ncbi:MAG: HEAT repeat domain-containing protein [Anaerofustis sp.]
MNDWLQSAVYYLIVFFISILLYFLFVLMIVHIKSSSIEKRKEAIRSKYHDVMDLYSLAGINTFDKHRIFRTPLGIMVLDEVMRHSSAERIQEIKHLISESSYDNYLRRLLRSGDPMTKIFTVKMVADLNLKQYGQMIFEMVLHETENSDLQYHALMALSQFGNEQALGKIFCNDRFTQKLTFRSIQEILKAYSGEKSRLYWILLDAPDLYVRRICIKRIGTEKIRRLGGFLTPYLNHSDYNIVIDTVRALGQLKYREALPEIEKLTEHFRWEVRAACVTALAQIDLKAEIGYITGGLFDEEWWVRRNAASAVIQYEPIKDIVSYVVRSDDRFAKEILAAAIRKKELLEYGGAR